MAAVPDEILKKLKKFLSMISASGIQLERAILFGSYAKGTANNWSDIDVALVSKDFTGIGFYDRQRVNPFIIKTDSRIEPHPFRPEDFTGEHPFVNQILKDAIEIPLSSDMKTEENELTPLKETLQELKKEGKVLVALLYGSYARGIPHVRSDIDLAVSLSAKDMEEEVEIIDKILMSTKKDVSILRLDDEDESPFVIQEALKGIHLIEPDSDTLYKVAHRALHETEEIRFRRALSGIFTKDTEITVK
ncbi:MAG: nucleotidyltransferase domain-containing protein [Candidatus Kuenenia sp.]|nr:nucleotidyltransferase domain-containing protein [Candidatus Kuenenia hertensis]